MGMGSLIPAILMSESKEREDAGMAGFGIIFAILIFYGGCVIGAYLYRQSFDLIGNIQELIFLIWREQLYFGVLLLSYYSDWVF